MIVYSYGLPYELYERLNKELEDEFQLVNVTDLDEIVKKLQSQYAVIVINDDRVEGTLPNLRELSNTSCWIVRDEHPNLDSMRTYFRQGAFDVIVTGEDEGVAIVKSIRDARQALNKRALEQRQEVELVDEVQQERASAAMTNAIQQLLFQVKVIEQQLPPTARYYFSLIHFYQKYRSEVYKSAINSYLQRRNLGAIFTNLDNRQEMFIVTTTPIDSVIIDALSVITEIPFRYSESIEIKEWKELHLYYEQLTHAPTSATFKDNGHYRFSRDSKKLQEIIEYVDQHYVHELTLDLLAKLFFLSKEHISRKFKELTGVKLSHYITDKRLEAAAERLKVSNDLIIETAIRVGYVDEKHFSKVFKEKYKVTPSKYRSMHKLKKD